MARKATPLGRSRNPNDIDDIIATALATELRAALPTEKFRCNCGLFVNEILVLNRRICIHVKDSMVSLQLIVHDFAGLTKEIHRKFDLVEPDSIEAILSEACWLVAFHQRLLGKSPNDWYVLIAWAQHGYRAYEWPC